LSNDYLRTVCSDEVGESEDKKTPRGKAESFESNQICWFDLRQSTWVL